MAVQAGEPVVRLNDLTELFIQISVPEKLFGTLGSSDIASIYATLPAAGDRQFPLTLREYAGEASAVAQSYRVTFAMAPVPGVQSLARDECNCCGDTRRIGPCDLDPT